MRDSEFLALSDWLAEDATSSAVTAEAELDADWSRTVSAARWTRLAPPALPVAEARVRPA